MQTPNTSCNNVLCGDYDMCPHGNKVKQFTYLRTSIQQEKRSIKLFRDAKISTFLHPHSKAPQNDIKKKIVVDF